MERPTICWGIDMKEKIEEIWNALQGLDMKPTPHNVSIMSGVYDFLRAIFQDLEKDGEADGRAQDCPEQRDNV